MCMECDYRSLLESVGLEPTGNRIRVLEVIGNNRFPLTAAEIFSTVERNQSINRVTIYRILELLVDYKLVERLSAGGRALDAEPRPHRRSGKEAAFITRGGM